jgi:CRISPR-associated protein Cas2
MNFERLNAYRIMWLIVYFDLPTETAKDRKNYAKFRKQLREDGFTMLQFSVYIRHCPSAENADVHQKRVEKILPPAGNVGILRITDKQYGNIVNFWGRKEQPLEQAPQQLELF